MKRMKYIAIALFLLIAACKRNCKTCNTSAYKITCTHPGFSTPYVSEVWGQEQLIDSLLNRGFDCRVDTIKEETVCDFDIDLLRSMGAKCR